MKQEAKRENYVDVLIRVLGAKRTAQIIIYHHEQNHGPIPTFDKITLPLVQKYENMPNFDLRDLFTNTQPLFASIDLESPMQIDSLEKCFVSPSKVLFPIELHTRMTSGPEESIGTLEWARKILSYTTE